ncbi:MFS transporter [Roseomonas sp. 18066]|uniref:MFS transporter n=1 Tax=Roseomonas sp. 18066 TaxID=2681412 RepID=UPI00135C17C6|nr:MFS transporter [Roseomonas sp. 18066]
MSGAAPPPPADPTLQRTILCIAASALLWTTQGLGMNLVAANTTQIQGALGATLNETNWLIAAYMAPNVSLTILLTKIRTQIGLRRFAEISLGVFVAAALLHLLVYDLGSAVAVRFLAGCAASPISSLAFLYMLDAFGPARKMSWGLSLALTLSSAMPTLARLISPPLLDIEQWHGLSVLEVGLALMALATAWLLPLTPVPRAKVLHWLDFVSYPLVAAGFGLLAVVLALGRLYWWFEAPWIGVCLALALLCIALAVAIELTREAPLMNFRWLGSPEIIHLTLTLLLFRIVLSEQTSGAYGLFQTLGLLNEQSATLYAVILAASVIGGLLCGALLKPTRVASLHAVALGCIALGAFMDSQATSLTRPGNMLLSQALIAFGGALFLPPATLDGLTRTMRQGPTYITSFLTVFLFTQSLGGLLGSALFGTFVTLREKFHSSQIVEQIVLTNPQVAERVRQLAGAYGHVLTDSRLLNAEGLALLAQTATREANVLAYNDAFLLVAVIASLALLALFLHTAFGHWRARLQARADRPA